MLNANPMRILVVAPHHDDEVIGCGGSIAYLSKNGYQVDVAYMTAGDVGIPGSESAQAIAIRETEAQRACQILGVGEKFFLRYADRDLSYSLSTVKVIIRLIRNGSYSGVLFPHANEQDYEHRVTYEIVSEAAWLSTTPYFPELGEPIQLKYMLLYEVWTPLSTYNMKIDVSDYITLKSKALSQYTSQFTPDQADRIVGLNTYRAAMHGTDTKAIEVFKYYTHE